jgi:tetratricopeptide (TPR) repeat protein
MGRKRSRSRSYSDDDSTSSRDAELNDYWRPVQDDPYDFDAWTRLLQYVEQRDDPKIASEAFDSFLKRYPFCFGYWRKYAELERRNHHYEKALNVRSKSILYDSILFRCMSAESKKFRYQSICGQRIFPILRVIFCRLFQILFRYRSRTKTSGC